MERSATMTRPGSTSGTLNAGAIATVDASDFTPRVMQGSGPIAVEFMSYSCSHCGDVEPLLRQVAASLQGREQIFRVNVVRDRELAGRFAIAGTPTLIMFLDGEIVGRVEGPEPSLAGLMGAVTLPFAA